MFSNNSTHHVTTVFNYERKCTGYTQLGSVFRFQPALLAFETNPNSTAKKFIHSTVRTWATKSSTTARVVIHSVQASRSVNKCVHLGQVKFKKVHATQIHTNSRLTEETHSKLK